MPASEITSETTLPGRFATWLDAYGDAWRRGDESKAGELFSVDTIYCETPFAPPLTGRKAVVNYWRAQTAEQLEPQFSYRVLASTETGGVALWTANFGLPDGSRCALDGVLTVEFDAQGLCRVFREWWHELISPRRATEPP
jgi:hypothetical protein